MRWIEFFERHSIPYVESGPNVSQGNVAIACPFCLDDPSHHMSVAINGAGWRCFRNKEHRGKNPVRLVQALLKCSHEQAQQLSGMRAIPTDFLGYVRSKLNQSNQNQSSQRRELKLLSEFKPFSETKPSCRPFLAHMRSKKRGFDDINFINEHGLRYCTNGPFRYRIIFPIEHEHTLVTWTGRAINNAFLRYKTLSPDADKAREERLPRAVGKISSYLFEFDYCMEADADTIYLCEGPFDALKMIALGRRHGVVATCFFTAGPSDEQILLLHTLLPKFKRRMLLLDRGTLPAALKFSADLRALNVGITHIPQEFKDPGELTRQAFLDLVDKGASM